MKLRARLLLAAGLLLSGGAGAALTMGSTVYVKAKNTKLFKTAKVDATPVDTLQPGVEVLWQKAQGKEWHQVKAGDKTGFVFFSNLSTKKPEPEYMQGKGAVDTRTFATSGAATKALAPAAQDMEKRGTSERDAVHDLLAAEALSQSKIGSADVVAHAKAAGLNPAVGVEP